MAKPKQTVRRRKATSTTRKPKAVKTVFPAYKVPAHIQDRLKDLPMAQKRQLIRQFAFRVKDEPTPTPTPEEANSNAEDVQNEPSSSSNMTVPSQNSDNTVESIMSAVSQIAETEALGKLVLVYAMNPAVDPNTGEQVDAIAGFTTPNDGTLKTVNVNLQGVDEMQNDDEERFEKMVDIISDSSKFIAETQAPTLTMGDNGWASTATPPFTSDAYQGVKRPVHGASLFQDTLAGRSHYGAQGGLSQLNINPSNHKPLRGILRITKGASNAQDVLNTNKHLGFLPALASIGKSLIGGAVKSLTTAATSTVSNVVDGLVNSVQ